jgi:hypothetical protein
VTYELGGDVEQSLANALGLGDRELAVQADQFGPESRSWAISESSSQVWLCSKA